jgi:Protein of unknown function (DUF3105)
LAKDRTPDTAPAKRTASPRSGAGAAGARGGKAGAKGGRTRPPANVVAPQRPWGLIAAAVAVVVFAAAVITYAVMQVNESNANRVESPDEIEGLQTFDAYEEPQDHVETPVDYAESPPVGGPHAPPPDWADCTGTVYDVDIRHENAVHSLEHGAVWITYNPDEVSGADVDTLAALVENESGRMLSPYAGLDSPVSIQSWGHQLKVDSADDPRLEQFADLMTLNNEFTPEPGASCENPTFITSPVVEEAAAQ